MTSDLKLPGAIFAAIVVLIAIPFLLDYFFEIRRPLLLEARIVTATGVDPVFSEGRKRVGPGEPVEAVVALRVGRRGTEGQWLAPVDRMALDGEEMEHVKSSKWPEAGRALRVFWFSVESTNLGGSLSPENAGERLQYRSFLATEMGRGLRAQRLPDTHNDDHIGEQSTSSAGGSGTVRLYARVEVVETLSDLRPLQAVTTIGVEAVFDPGFPTISRSVDFGGAVNDDVGELFRLPGFEPKSEGGEWNEATTPAFGMSFTDLVSKRFVTSSRTLAAVAVAGRADVDLESFDRLGSVEITEDRANCRGRALEWGTDVVEGDVLIDGDHWWVLLGDDGNGQLDPADAVLHCWGRPPERTTLWASLESETLTVEHARYAD
jgi:hypothetical protein